jgi:hypothetical protein
MSKKPASKRARRKDSDEKLAPKEWQARHDAACAIVARKYCDMFNFWRDCRYKPCRSARRCVGDQGACLQKRWTSVPYDVGHAAEMRMLAETPPNADRFTRLAHHYGHHSLCLHDPKNQKTPHKSQAETRAEVKVQVQDQPKSRP